MKSRALRVALAVLFVLVLGTAAYAVWNQESQVRTTTHASLNFDARTWLAVRSLLEIKSAQPGYVAAGQGDEYWSTKVDGLLKETREGLAALRASARVPVAQAEIDAAAASLEDFEQMDRRAREYTHGGQRLLASDLVFSDGIEKIDGAVASLERARSLEDAARGEDVRQRRRAQLLALTGAAAAGFLVLALLTPLPYESVVQTPVESRTPAAPAAKTAGTPAAASPARREASKGARHSGAPVQTGQSVQAVQNPQPSPRPAPNAAAPAIDLGALASLCTDLARVLDTRGLPGALERAAKILDAGGIVIWIADPDGRELAPVLAHGYPQNILSRMGTIGRDAENVTAAAFRTGLVQTVKADDVSPGAIAAPLLTPSGTVGVMAAEVLHEGERREAVRAAAGIVAAQLATLMGPPAPRASGKAEVAG